MSYRGYTRSGKFIGPRTIVVNDVPRSGPRSAWEAHVAPRQSNSIEIGRELPAVRARVWNVASAAFAFAAIWAAHALGHLAFFLIVLGAMVAATVVAIVVLGRRNAPRTPGVVGPARRVTPAVPGGVAAPAATLNPVGRAA